MLLKEPVEYVLLCKIAKINDIIQRKVLKCLRADSWTVIIHGHMYKISMS